MNKESDTSDMPEDIQKNAEGPEGQLSHEKNTKSPSLVPSQSENRDTNSEETTKQMDHSLGDESDEEIGARKKKRALILNDNSDDENDESLRNSILSPRETCEELSNKSSDQNESAGNTDITGRGQQKLKFLSDGDSNEDEKADKPETLQDEDSKSNSETVANIDESKKKTLTRKENLTDELEENNELAESRGEEIGLARKKKRVKILSDDSDDENDITMKSRILTPGENFQEPSNDKSSDQDNESDESKDITEGRYRKLKFLCDDDSSEEENRQEETEDNQLQSFPDEESLSNSVNVGDIGKSKKKKKKKTKSSKKQRGTEILDENKEPSENSDEEFSEEVQKIGKRKSKKPDKPKKPSKKERDEVFSMMQRNAREETIEIPYNKPEQYDLKEFLSRLQQNKMELPIDKKLAKKTGKLGALKREKIVPDEDLKKTNETQEVYQTDSIAKQEIAKEDQLPEQLTESEPIVHQDELDQLVAETAKETALEPIQIPKDKNIVKRLILHGDPNSVIDLESGLVVPKTKSKEVLLIEKCLSQNAKPHGVAKPEIKVENSPGVAYKNLMESLSKELLRKKREQMQKYIEEQEKSKIVKMANNIDDEAEFASDIDEDEIEKDDEDNNDGEDGKEDQFKENDELGGSELNENETEEHDKSGVNEEESENENEANDEDSETEDQSSERKKKLRKRIVVMDGEDSDDEQLKDDDHGEEIALPVIPNENILLPGPEHNTSVTESQMEKDEMELFNLCTGNFETQAPPQSINLSDPGLDRSLQECAGTATHEIDNEIQAVPNFESSDDEKTTEDVQVKKKCRKPRVYLSDDEEPQQKDDGEFSKESEDQQESDGEFSKEAEHEELSEVAEISDQEECEEDAENIAYDSEENEIDTTTVSALPTKPKIKVSDFMENEAELSESEWGSADEDEKDLDKLEAELGDEDQFDQAQLQSELERIHMKKLLDQDARDVKMVKNLVLHEEEREGMTRERTFRWLHVDNDFNLNGEDRQDSQFDETRESDDENEEEWRKIRYERDVMLKQKLQGDLSNIFETKNVTILKPSIPEHPKEVKAPTFLVPDQESMNRKSLLLQDEEYLARLAVLTSKTTDTLVNGATEKGSFVFRQLARQEEDPEPSAGKRKPDNALAPVKGKKRKKTSIYG